jgi:Tol biopolymer transport system component
MHSIPPKTNPSVQSIKRDPTPTVPPKTSSGAQNTKTGPDALGTAENETGSAKHENVTRPLWYRRKRIRARKKRKRDPTTSVPPKKNPGAQYKKTRPEALGTAENESGSAKHENVTRPLWYRRKRIRARKKRKRDPTPSVPPKKNPGAQYMKT